jgi:hypothetical protein
MKKLLMTAAALLALAVPAQADQLPGVYFGDWCGEHHYNEDRDDKTYERGHSCEGPIQFEIRPNGFNVDGKTCRFASVRKTGQSWPRWTKPKKGDYPEGDWVPEVDVVLKCDGWSSTLRLSWSKGDILMIQRR